MSVWGTKVVNCNLQATKDWFLHPSKVNNGRSLYKKVRNPDDNGDLFCHLSFILLFEPYIHYVYITYICINLVIIMAVCYFYLVIV